MNKTIRSRDGGRVRAVAAVLAACLLIAAAHGCASTTPTRDGVDEARRILDTMKQDRTEDEDQTSTAVADAGTDVSLAASGSEDARDLLQSMVVERRLQELDTQSAGADDASGVLAAALSWDEELPGILNASTDGASTSDEPDDINSALRELEAVFGGDAKAAVVADAPPTPAPAPAVDPAALPTEPTAPTEPVTVAVAPAASTGDVQAEVTLRSPPAQEAAPAEAKPRPPGNIQFYTFFHKTTEDFIDFLAADFRDILDAGHVARVEDKRRTAMFFGDDAMLQRLTALANEYDDIELERQEVIIRPKFVDVGVVMEALTMAGLANVWMRVDETITTQQQQGNKIKTIGVYKHGVYSQGGFAQGSTSPVPVPPKIPFVFNMPWSDPFEIPRQSTGKADVNPMTLDFRNSSSTEQRGVMIAVGTAEDIERIQTFVDTIDKPARQVMIEVQLLELQADSLTDIGLDSIQLGKRHSTGQYAGPLPGEPIRQPGIPDAPKRSDDIFVPDVVSEGLTFLFDDTTEDIAGQFMAAIHLLARTGDAEIKARPKILTLDDRQSILHFGEEIPTFVSTQVNRDVTGGNFVENVNTVTTQYVGITLNMRPKVCGDQDDHIALQLEVVANFLQGRERVFAEDLLGIPIVARRHFFGQQVVKNHRPIILGGIIQEEESESITKVPYLGDIPVLGRLFSRVQTQKTRKEIILIVTPHILSDSGWDPIATPKETIHFDTFDSVLFNDRYILKGRDVWGIDPITKRPADMNGHIFSEEEIIDLTLLNIVKQRELVSRLSIFTEYLAEESKSLGWLQRRYPERSVYYWPEEEKVIYYKAAAICIENIKSLNPDLDYDELVLPRREIVLPTTPYRMSLTYDKYKTLKEYGKPVLRDSGAVLTEATVALLRDVGMQRSLGQFTEYVKRNGIEADDHGSIRYELERLYSKLMPESNAAQTDDYVELLDTLVDMKITFVTMATYFQDNLADRYRVRGAPKIGNLERDLQAFLKTTISISQRAKDLIELEKKWGMIAGEDIAR